MKATVGLLSDRTVLHSKMERLCPDKFQFAVLVPSRVWGRHAPTRKLSRRGTTFSRIENLRPRDGSCAHTFTLFAIFFLESLSFFRYNKIERRWA